MSVDTILGQWPTLKVGGEIDLSNIDDLRAAVDNAISRSPTGFIVDLTSVSYIDSAGVAVTIGAYRRVSKTGGTLAVVKPIHEGVRRVLDLIGLHIPPNTAVTEDLAAAEEALANKAARTSI